MTLPDGLEASPTPGEAPANLRLSGPVAVIANSKSGTAGAASGLMRELLDAISRLGGQPIEMADRGDISRQLSSCREVGAEVIVAVGGDGTIAGAAAEAVGCGASLLPIPAGSMNLFVQDMALPVTPDRMLPHLGDLTCLAVDYATVNGTVFLHSSLIGVVPRLGRLRERFRAGGLLDRLALIPSMVGEAFGSEAIDVEIASDAGRTTRRTRSVAVTNNPLSGQKIVSHQRLSIASGTLGVYASAHAGAFASLRLLLALGTGRLPQDSETLSARCHEAEIGSPRERMLVSNDGEVFEMEPPLRYRIHKRGLRVLVPTAFVGGRPA